MTLCYAHRTKDPFVRFNKRIVMDSSISWKAKGLLTYAFSRPDDWKFYKKEMIQHASDGEKSFDSGIKELEKSGYLHRRKKHEEGTGKFEGLEWHFFEEPISEEEFKKSYRNTGFGGTGETPVPVKRSPTKKEEKTEKENNNPASPIVIFSCLDKVKVPYGLKKKLCEEHPEPVVEQAVEAVWRYAEDDHGRLLRSAIKGNWIYTPSREQEISDSKAKEIQARRERAQNEAIEPMIVNETCVIYEDISICPALSYSDKNFDREFDLMLKYAETHRTVHATRA